MPVTVTDIPGTGAGVVEGGVVMGGVACAIFKSAGCDTAGDTSPACCDDGTGVCAAACCARTGMTVLIRASATADAIGVFLSFMTFPLVLALAMRKTAGRDVSSGRDAARSSRQSNLQYDRNSNPRTNAMPLYYHCVPLCYQLSKIFANMLQMRKRQR